MLLCVLSQAFNDQSTNGQIWDKVPKDKEEKQMIIIGQGGTSHKLLTEYVKHFSCFIQQKSKAAKERSYALLNSQSLQAIRKNMLNLNIYALTKLIARSTWNYKFPTKHISLLQKKGNKEGKIKQNTTLISHHSLVTTIQPKRIKLFPLHFLLSRPYYNFTPLLTEKLRLSSSPY